MGQAPSCHPDRTCFGHDCCSGRVREQKLIVKTVAANHWSSHGRVQHAARNSPRKGFVIQLDNKIRRANSDAEGEELAEQTLPEWHSHVQRAPQKRVSIQLEANKDDDSNAEVAEGLGTRTLSEWYAEEPDGEFVEVAPANMKIATDEDYENFMKFKSLSNWLQDGQPRPSCESEKTESYFVHDPSQPDE
mmetsp:Transcript_114331/g.198174  ORF Transcript_114331/g.198174 Transcript_114331/m.198174 type:complete len:190 (-) Transcript_114331:82-651(-)